MPWTEQDKSLFKLLNATIDQKPDGSVPGPCGRGRILLVGETQCGKTTLLRYWAERIHGKRVVACYAGTDSAEDIAGWPVRDSSGARPRLSFTNPSVIPYELLSSEQDGKWVLLIDEVDKTPPDVLSALLSLLAENRLRDTIIKPFAIVLAANEFVRMPHPSLLARVIGVPYPPPDYDLLARPDLQFVKPFLQDVQFKMDSKLWADRITPPGAAHRLAKWIRTKVFWHDHAVMDWVLEGSCSPEHAASIRARMRDIPESPPLVWAQQADPAELAAGLVFNLVAQDGATAKGVQQILHQRASDDATGEIARVLDSFYGQRRVQAALEPHAHETDVQAQTRTREAQTLMHKKYTKLTKDQQTD